MCTCRWVRVAIALFMLMMIVGVAWLTMPHAMHEHMEIVHIVGLCIAVVYIACGMLKRSFWPPTMWRAVLHTFICTSYWWTTALIFALGRDTEQTARRTHRYAMSLGYLVVAIFLTIFMGSRICIEDHRERMHRRRLARQRQQTQLRRQHRTLDSRRLPHGLLEDGDENDEKT